MEIKEFENKILAKDTQTLVENDSPSILKEFRMKELKENRDLMIANGKYIYIESFVKKSRSNYELGDVQKFRELLTYKKMEFSEDDLLWLIQEEIKNQEYLEFREKLMIQKPENHWRLLRNSYKNLSRTKGSYRPFKKAFKRTKHPIQHQSSRTNRKNTKTNGNQRIRKQNTG